MRCWQIHSLAAFVALCALSCTGSVPSATELTNSSTSRGNGSTTTVAESSEASASSAASSASSASSTGLGQTASAGQGTGSSTGATQPTVTAYLLKNATFEGGVAGQQPTQGPTGFDGEGGNNEFSAEQAYGGQLSAKMFKYPGVGTFSFGGRMDYPDPLVAGDEVWWRAATLFPTAQDHNANPRLKFFRILRIQRGDGQGWGYLDWYINDDGTHRYIYEPAGVRVDTGDAVLAQTLAGPDDFGTQGDPGSAMIPGEWAEWQLHVRLHPYPADVDPEGAFVRFYKNGQLIHERSDIPTLLEDTSGDTFAAYGLFMTYWNGVSDVFPSDGSWYVDDFTVAVNRDLTGALPSVDLNVTEDGYPVIPLVSDR